MIIYFTSNCTIMLFIHREWLLYFFIRHKHNLNCLTKHYLAKVFGWISELISKFYSVLFTIIENFFTAHIVGLPLQFSQRFTVEKASTNSLTSICWLRWSFSRIYFTLSLNNTFFHLKNCFLLTVTTYNKIIAKWYDQVKVY